MRIPKTIFPSTSIILTWLFVLGCNSDKPKIKKPENINSGAIVDSVTVYFKSFPIGGGWDPVKFEWNNGDVNIKVKIPTAAGIMENSPELQLRAVSVACPSKLEPIWNTNGLEDIVIQGSTMNGDIFITVSCKKLEQ